MTDSIEVAVLKPDDTNFNRVQVHARTAYGPEASWIAQLVQACAIPWPDGETKSGQQAYRLPTPEEAVKRAFSIVDGMRVEFERRDWSAPIPAVEDLRIKGDPVGFRR
jgi:hypothetical protein